MPKELLLRKCLERVAGAVLWATLSFSIVVPGRALLLSRFRAISLAKLLTGAAHSACSDLSIHRGSIGWKTVLHTSIERGELSRGGSRLELSRV